MKTVDVIGYENYMVNEKGEFFTKPRQGSFSKITKMKTWFDKNGYERISFRNNGKRKFFLAHRIIAEAFIPNPKNKSQINHIDSNPSNNSINNLEWCTPKENIKHSEKYGKNTKEVKKKRQKKSSLSKGLKAKIRFNMMVGSTFGDWKVLGNFEKFGNTRKVDLLCRRCNIIHRLNVDSPLTQNESKRCRKCYYKVLKRKTKYKLKI